MSHETIGKSDEWFTPKYVFDALDCVFDVDVAAPTDRTFVSVPARKFITADSLIVDWDGFVWMNPPYGDKETKMMWIKKFFSHGCGIALTPARTGTKWWHYTNERSDLVLFPNRKIHFIQPDGTTGNGGAGINSCLWASGERAIQALRQAEKNGLGRNMICEKSKLEYDLL